MNRKKIILSTFLIVAFCLWYILVYNKKSGAPNLSFPEIDNNEEHLIFGLPLAEGLHLLKYTGFYSGYSSSVKNPAWVSYHLSSKYLQATKILKKRKFKQDPSLSGSLSATLADYRKSGFDRGHLARQADMYGRNRFCEEEACYLTNISPQKTTFNRRTWLNLENAVQQWTRQAGQLWIICGPFFDNNHTFLQNDSSGVEIPDGFFKILVRQGKQAKYDFLSFVLEQQDTSLNLEAYVVSIDSIETLTGLDFFPRLEDRTENYIEKKISPLWKNWR